MALSQGRPSQKLPPKTLASLQNEGEKARLNVDVPKDLYWKLKRRAVDERTTVTEIILKLVSKYLSE
jgi:hypothetical protein